MSEMNSQPVKRSHQEFKDTNYELLILALSILSISNLFFDAFIVQDEQVVRVIYLADIALSFIFMSDFLYRFATADSKINYFIKQLGWLDLLGSLPFPRIRILRLARIIRAVRLMRKLGLKKLINEFVRDRAGSAFYSVGLLVLLMLEFGSAMILVLERSAPEANITTAQEAIWWSLVTMSTVGYGDYYPVSLEGRLFSIGVILIGVGLFGVITGFLANRFIVGEDDEAEAANAQTMNDLLAEIKTLQQQQTEMNTVLQTKLEALTTAVARQSE